MEDEMTKQGGLEFMLYEARSKLAEVTAERDELNRAHQIGAIKAQPAQEPAAWQDFTEWMHREMPSGTVIGDSGWWASRIFRKFIAPQPAPDVERDAARYRWLRNGGNDEIGAGIYDPIIGNFCFTTWDKDLDDAIDAAMKGPP